MSNLFLSYNRGWFHTCGKHSKKPFLLFVFHFSLSNATAFKRVKILINYSQFCIDETFNNTSRLIPLVEFGYMVALSLIDLEFVMKMTFFQIFLKLEMHVLRRWLASLYNQSPSCFVKEKSKLHPIETSPPFGNRPLMRTWHGNKWNICNTVCRNHGFACK
jgi:hypothetical protein